MLKKQKLESCKTRLDEVRDTRSYGQFSKAVLYVLDALLEAQEPEDEKGGYIGLKNRRRQRFDPAPVIEAQCTDCERLFPSSMMRFDIGDGVYYCDREDCTGVEEQTFEEFEKREREIEASTKDETKVNDIPTSPEPLDDLEEQNDPNELGWLSRDVIRSPYYWTLCLSQDDFDKAMDTIYGDNIPNDIQAYFIKKGFDAQTRFFVDNEGRDFCLICMNYEPERDPSAPLGLLVHEAVHLWQAFKDKIGEGEPSDEFEAYGIQHFSQCLIHEYHRRTE